MILTRQKHIPWSWAALMAIPTGVFAYVEACSGGAMTFTMKKYISDPALITFIGSINIAFNFLVAPYTAWKSDTIWTRWGRRKPFLVVGWGLLALAMIAAPMCPGIWSLAAMIVVYQFCVDFGYSGPWSPLYYEVIPPHQRGRAVVMKRFASVFAGLYMNYVLIGQFDEIYQLKVGLGIFGNHGWTITGEQVIYWLGAALVLVVVLHIGWNVKELPPVHAAGEQSRGGFSPRTYLKLLFGEQQWRLLMLLVFCASTIPYGLGQLTPLLITEQFGYSKAVMGKIGVIAIAVEIAVVLPFVALVGDRVDRYRVFKVGLILAAFHPIGYWLYVKYLALNQVPSVLEITAFTIYSRVVDGMVVLMLEPLFFDFVPRNMMGTINSALLFVRGALGFLLGNGTGLWVRTYSKLFCAPGSYDYMSGYLYLFIMSVIGVIAAFYFGEQMRKGRIIRYGRLEEEATP